MGLDVGAEDRRDGKGDQREDQHQRPGGVRPVGRHAVAGQVAGHDVEQAGHRRGAGKPENEDRRDVVDGAEAIAQEVVGQVGQGAAGGLAALFELLVRDQERGHEARWS